jgi:hypothetical protein
MLRSISFKRPAEEYGACFGCRAFGQEGEVPTRNRKRWDILIDDVRVKERDSLVACLFTLNCPHRVPTSDSRRSFTRFTIVASAARAIRLLSDLRNRRSAEAFALAKKYSEKYVRRGAIRTLQRRNGTPEISSSVVTRSRFNSSTESAIALTCYPRRIRPFDTSTFVYSRRSYTPADRRAALRTACVSVDASAGAPYPSPCSS